MAAVASEGEADHTVCESIAEELVAKVAELEAELAKAQESSSLAPLMSTEIKASNNSFVPLSHSINLLKIA